MYYRYDKPAGLMTAWQGITQCYSNCGNYQCVLPQGVKSLYQIFTAHYSLIYLSTQVSSKLCLQLKTATSKTTA